MNYCSPDETYLSAKIELLYDSARHHRNQDIWGNTCLHDAVLKQNLTQLEKKLHAFPELINITDLWITSQSTPLLLAIKMGNTSAASLLINHNANLNQADYWKFTPLHYACLYRLNPLIQALLNAGANPWLKNYYNKIPLDYYRQNITPQDLNYPYGYTSTNQLKKTYDNNPYYKGTQCEDYSALRWFVHLVNDNQYPEHLKKQQPLSNSPIWDKTHYLKQLDIFLINRARDNNPKCRDYLIWSLAKTLNTEYNKRYRSCFRGFIRTSNLLRKIKLTESILSTITPIETQDHDGRSKKLMHYFNSVKKN